MGQIKTIVAAGCLALAALAASAPAQAMNERARFVSTGQDAKAPIGWIEFCGENAAYCSRRAGPARDAVLTTRNWRELVRINKSVNDRIKPMTDMEHFGVVEKWSFPDDGYGDCEDYVLLKQRMLIEAGWPAQALLITVVRDRNNEGHAVLTVKTDKGEYVLDNQEADIMIWSETDYRYVKRQSQTDPNLWISLGDPRPAVATSASSRQ